MMRQGIISHVAHRVSCEQNRATEIIGRSQGSRRRATLALNEAHGLGVRRVTQEGPPNPQTGKSGLGGRL